MFASSYPADFTPFPTGAFFEPISTRFFKDWAEVSICTPRIGEIRNLKPAQNDDEPAKIKFASHKTKHRQACRRAGGSDDAEATPALFGPRFRKSRSGSNRSQSAKPYTAPVSLRMSFEEKSQLERDAAGMSIAAYIRWRLFDPDKPPPRTRGKHPVKDQQAIAQLYALLGQSRLARQCWN